MKNNEKRIFRRSYKNLTKTEIIRLGNSFVDDFLFEDNKAVDVPINALRTIFNIAADLRNEQLRPQDRPMQLSLFEEEFEPLKTVLKKKNYFAEKLNYEQPQPLSQPFPFFLEEKFLVKTLTRQ
jgi:hypothetical protein